MRSRLLNSSTVISFGVSATHQVGICCVGTDPPRVGLEVGEHRRPVDALEHLLARPHPVHDGDGVAGGAHVLHRFGLAAQVALGWM